MKYIEFKNVKKEFSNKKVFDDLSFQITKGKIVSFVGPYGSGKTTILKLLSGLIESDSGSISIGGKTPKELLENRKIGFAFQETLLLPWKTVLENLQFPLLINNNQESSNAMDLLKLVNLEEKANSYPRELSGGTQKIISILRAIILNPTILLLDEPFSAIDEINRDELHEKLIDIHNCSKQTIVLVTHSINEAVYLSDEVYVLGENPARIVKTIKPVHHRIKKMKYSYETLKEINMIRDILKEGIKDA